MSIFLINDITIFVTIGASGDTHNTAAAEGALIGVFLAVLVIYGICLDLNIWFLNVIKQYRSFVTVRVRSFQTAKIFVCTLTGTRERAWARRILPTPSPQR